MKCEVERENEMEEKLASNQANGRTRRFYKAQKETRAGDGAGDGLNCCRSTREDPENHGKWIRKSPANINVSRECKSLCNSNIPEAMYVRACDK